MTGRFIGENIRPIDCIIQYASEKNIPELLLFIDFEKVFDFLEWSFIFDTLRFFGFGDSIINWVKVFFIIIRKAVCWASNFFETQSNLVPRVLRGTLRKFNFFDWLFRNGFHCFTAEILRK